MPNPNMVASSLRSPRANGQKESPRLGPRDAVRPAMRQGSSKGKLNSQIRFRAPSKEDIFADPADMDDGLGNGRVLDDAMSDDGSVSTVLSASSTGSVDAITDRIGSAVASVYVKDRFGHPIPHDQLVSSLIGSISYAIRTMAPMAIIVMDRDGNIVDVNPRVLEVFGRSKEETIGKNVKIFMPPEIAAKHDSYVQNYLNNYERKRRPPRSSIVNAKGGREILAMKQVDGRMVPFSAYLTVRAISHPGGKHLAPLCFLGYLNDITEQREKEEALQINDFIREKGDTPLVVINNYGKIIDFNQAAADLFRYNRTFIIGQNIKKLMPPEIAAVHDEKLEAHRERVATGMLHTSPVVGKIRNLKGYRPCFEKEGCEEFNLELRVESFSGGKVLVAFIKDLDSVDSSKFMQATTEDTFPAHTVDRLMQGVPVWDKMNSVTVLFSDIVAFSSFSTEMAADEVYGFINSMVSAFDELGYGMEKIKTIGDGYMAYFLSAEDAIYTSLRMLEWSQENGVGIRIGLHTGEAVSGVIGTRRRTFDMWGDTVNTAKRMEEQGIGGQLQISAETFSAITVDELREIFVGHSAKVKGKGIHSTYVTELPEDHIPGEILNLMADRDVEERTRKAALNRSNQKR